MINVEIKYCGNPVMWKDKNKKDVKRYEDNYLIEETGKEGKTLNDSPKEFIIREIVNIFKKYEGICSIKFYKNGT